MATGQRAFRSRQPENGFVKPILEELDDAQPLPILSSAISGPKAYKEMLMRDLVDKHRLVEDMLHIKGSYFPGLEAMQLATKAPTASDLTNLVEEAQRQHKEEIEKLMDLQAKDHLSRVLDLYQSTDGIVNLPELDEFIGATATSTNPVFDDAMVEYDYYRWAHLKTLSGLMKRREELLAKETSERKLRDAQFPRTIAQWTALDRDTQLRVARFLVADKSTQERMLSQFGWAWKQVEPLKGDYQHNSTFQGDINMRARDADAGDPHRNAS
ncbi:hypothetical protein PsYK624_064670 [Phanerochaete sordida]|uniref:Uncharacterized protein n=1 Tax=Phanerochaete sordida TaxID=48140 RepID=A0A9P3G8P1_9APHY|nr:hypothetical protein PsYK624_064670 [Phanerochaete sordida]